RRLLRLFLQVCEGVGFAHERGVIHRDLKPANVMLGEGDEVLVMDWGLAKEIAAPDDLARAGAGAEPLEQAAGLTQEGALVGTPAYMPIEQADGARLDARADVYALGAILYELLTGQAPYRGMAMEVVAKLLTAPPPRPRELDPELPPALEAIVLRAMGREPEERYPSAAALAADVSAFLDDEPIAAYPEGPLAGLARLTRTHKLPLAAAALGLLTLVGAALGGRALVETAQRAADEAGAAAAEVEARALSASEQAARAERVVGAARELASEEQRVTRFARSVAAGADLESLIAAHAEARAALGESSASSAELGQLAERLGERRQSARRALDRALLATLVARAPERALEVLAQGQLQPGPERWLAHARALLRLERHAEAAELLAKSDPGDEPRWRRARGALLAVARRADWSEQEAALSAAVQSWRAAAWPYLRRAQARVCLGQREAAEADFARARELDPRDCWNSIAWLEVAPLATHYKLIDLRAQTARELGSPRTAVLAICESALRKSTWQWDRGQAVETLRKRIPGRWESLEEGIRLRLSARSYLIVRDLERALPQARRAVELRPQDPTARAVLAEALLLAVVLDQRQDLLEQDLLEQARAELRAGLEIAPHHPDLCYVGGRLELRAGRAASAEPMLRRGAQASGDSGRWNLLALACLAQSERAAWERGVEAAKHAVAADPYGAYINPERLRGKWAARPLAGDPSWQRTWALLCEKLGRTEEALLHAMRAQTLSRQPNAQRAYGETRRDYFLAARLAEKLQLLEIARQCYGLAAKAPRLQERAEAALKRLGPGED
ncbi:MAG TPA: hypothetical protein DEA08_30330, partial [Planctomycetes bacterium]|nr:hypothetical protein [Planctomycetota bacterium]